MSLTLTTLRDRLKTQLMSALGFPETAAVSASTANLQSITSRLQATLQDSSEARWSAEDLKEAIHKAVEQYSRFNPHHAISTIDLSAAGREIDISSISDLLRVEKVWWDYDTTTPGYPPNWRQFDIWPGGILYIDDEEEPQSADTVRIWYTKKQTLDGLDAATATTIPDEDIVYVVTGAAQFAAEARAIELSEELNVDGDVVERLRSWADEQGVNFRYGLKQRQPAWQRYAKAYAQENLDEAIRWALQRYTQVSPHRAITTITLTADGREVDISTITNYLQVERVWWDYDASDPEHPPNWRDFEPWPGDILFIKDPDEPQSGDTVRIWYTTPHTIDGLDSATSTSLPTDHETLILLGAAGFAAQEHEQEQEGWYIKTRLRQWADARLTEFERALALLARQNAARHSGIAQGPNLDRWDSRAEGWW